MESFSPPKDFDAEREPALKSNNNKVAVDPEAVADKLLAALASGNFEHLEQARQAFVAEPKVETIVAEKPLQPPVTFADTDEIRLREEEEALRRAEQELEQRRAEVQAARKRAEEDARLRVIEVQRREFETEARRRAAGETERLANLDSTRKQLEAVARERARKKSS